MRITSKYRKFKKALLAKKYPERYIFSYYEEANEQSAWDPFTLEELLEDFATWLAEVKKMEREDADWSTVYNDAMERALTEAKGES